MSELDTLQTIYSDPKLSKRQGEQFQLKNIGIILSRYGLELSPNQYLRELLENSFEALNRREDWGDEYPQVQIHPEWNKFDRSGVCQFVMCDNGIGFPSASSLISQCKTMMSTGNAEEVSLRDGNFGMGGRISTLYWNPFGVIYASWHKGEGWMIRLRIHPVTGQPELFPFPVEDSDGNIEYESAIPAPDAYKFETIKDNGTAVILTGKTGKEHTYFGPYPDLIKTEVKGRAQKLTGGIYSMHKYLNHRYATLPAVVVNNELVTPKVGIFVSTSNLDQWPRNPKDAKLKVKNGKRYTFRRRIHGFAYYQKAASQRGTIYGPNFRIYWCLHSEKTAKSRPSSILRSVAQVGVLYNHEIYENSLENQSNLYNLFGIYRKPIAKRVTILIEPFKASDESPIGISPDGSRSRLLWNDLTSGSNRLPMERWARTFEENMPEVIKKALADLADEGATEDLNKKLKKDLNPYLKNLKRHYYKPIQSGDSNIGGKSGVSDTSGDDTTPTTNSGNTGNGGSRSNGGRGSSRNPKKRKPRLPSTGSGSTRARRVNKRITLPEVLPLTLAEAEREGIREDQIGIYIEEKHVILFNTGWTIACEQILKHVDKHRDLPGIFEEVYAQIVLCYSTSLIEKILEHYKRKGSDNWPIDTWKAQLSTDALTFSCSDRLGFDIRINASLGQRVGKMKRDAAETS